MINDKVVVALEAGLKVILCVGEKLEERKAGKMKDIVFKQLSTCVGNVKINSGSKKGRYLASFSKVIM